MYKRPFDLTLATLLFVLLLPVMLLLCFLAAIDTQSNGLFIQQRVGQHGVFFNIIKLRTWHQSKGTISRFGGFLRKYKLDEWPQLYNVLKGDMSLVGPRPDIAGYYDMLQGEDRKVLLLKPGITGLASLKYSNEEAILASQSNPLVYNDQVIFPDKVRLNLIYLQKKSLIFDCLIMLETLFPLGYVSQNNF